MEGTIMKIVSKLIYAMNIFHSKFELLVIFLYQ